MPPTGNKLRRPSPIRDSDPVSIRRLTAEIRRGWNPYEYDLRRQEARARQEQLLGIAPSGCTVQ